MLTLIHCTYLNTTVKNKNRSYGHAPDKQQVSNASKNFGTWVLFGLQRFCTTEILPHINYLLTPVLYGIFLSFQFKWHRGVLLVWELIIVVVYIGIWFIPPAHPHVPSNTTETFSIREVSACSFAGAPPYLFVEDSNDCSWSCDLTPSRCADWQINDACTLYQTSNFSFGKFSWPEVRFYFICISMPSARNRRKCDFLRVSSKCTNCLSFSVISFSHFQTKP